MKKLKVYHLSQSEWGGRIQARTQDFIVDARGPYMCLDASYFKHQFAVMEIRYEQNKDTRLHLEESDERSCL